MMVCVDIRYGLLQAGDLLGKPSRHYRLHRQKNQKKRKKYLQNKKYVLPLQCTNELIQ